MRATTASRVSFNSNQTSLPLRTRGSPAGTESGKRGAAASSAPTNTNNLIPLLPDRLRIRGTGKRLHHLVHLGRIDRDGRRHFEEDVGLVHVPGEEQRARAFGCDRY